MFSLFYPPKCPEIPPKNTFFFCCFNRGNYEQKVASAVSRVYLFAFSAVKKVVSFKSYQLSAVSVLSPCIIHQMKMGDD